MVATTVSRPASLWLRNRQLQHAFFAFLTMAMAGMVFYGFAHTIFLAPLPNLLVHIHAAFFSSWFLLLLVQGGLAWTGRLQWHRTLGMVGFGIAIGMVILGTMTLRFQLSAHRTPPFIPPLQWHFYQLADIAFAFPILVLCAFLYRRNPKAHKRLIVLATLMITDAGIDRWPIMQTLPRYYLLVSAIVYSYIVLMAIYDFAFSGKPHPATVWGGAFIILVRETRWQIGASHAWQVICFWARNHGLISF